MYDLLAFPHIFVLQNLHFWKIIKYNQQFLTYFCTSKSFRTLILGIFLSFKSALLEIHHIQSLNIPSLHWCYRDICEGSHHMCTILLLSGPLSYLLLQTLNFFNHQIKWLIYPHLTDLITRYLKWQWLRMCVPLLLPEFPPKKKVVSFAHLLLRKYVSNNIL